MYESAGEFLVSVRLERRDLAKKQLARPDQTLWGWKRVRKHECISSWNLVLPPLRALIKWDLEFHESPSLLS